VAAEHTPFLARLRRNDTDAVASDSDAVRAMLDSRGWQLVNELIEGTHEEATTRLVFGHVGTDGRILEQAEYARILGFLAGLRQTRWAAEAFLLLAEREHDKES
jgi:hypothetical protein